MIGASDTVILTGEALLSAVVILLLLILWSAFRRNTSTILRKFRVGFFVERDLMRPEDMPPDPPKEEWVHPPDDPTLYEQTQEASDGKE